MNINIDSEFPGGNIIVNRAEDDAVYLQPDLRDTDGPWFYWHFRVRGAAARKLTFIFCENGDNAKPLAVIGSLGPAVSREKGRNWVWLEKSGNRSSSFSYSFAENEHDIRFCVAVPYLQSDLDSFLKFMSGSPCLRKETLCITEKGRSAEKLILEDARSRPGFTIALSARHHACESMADFVLEGFLTEAASDSPAGKKLRSLCRIIAVPFMDKDGVEHGDQGKNRKPHDHNRDYGKGGDVYETVRAFKKELRKTAFPVIAAIDLHCPWLYDKKPGGWNEKIYQVGTKSDDMWKSQQLFASYLEQEDSRLPYRASNDLPFGTSWNTPRPDPDIKSCTDWCSGLAGIRLATSIEIPYALCGATPNTPDASRSFGAALASAMASYISQEQQAS